MQSPEAPSVYQRVLGSGFAALDPGLRAYFGPIPPGAIGVGRGVYDLAGSRVRALRPVFALMAWRHVLFPEFGRGIPFTVVNTPAADGTLGAARSFGFAERTRIMRDAMSVDGGLLVDRLGRRGGLEVVLAIAVVDGGVRMRSRRLGLRVGSLRLPLPRVATVTVDERVEDGTQRVDVRVVAPLIGEVFRYSGSFTYVHVLQEVDAA